jgi:hypothetical protein
MAVHSTSTRQDFPGTGSTGPFVLNFPFHRPQDLTLTKLSQTGAPTYLELGFDYRVTGAGQGKGGTIITTRPVNVGELLVVVRETEETQATVYQEGADFPAHAHEAALDKLTMIAQDQGRDVARSVKIPLLNRTIDSAEVQNVGANRIIMFNSDASGIIARNPRDAILDQTGGAINVPINLLNHNFQIGQVLAQVGANLALADASNPLLCEVVGVVTAIENQDNFTLTTTGQVTCFTGLTPGLAYFLADNSPGSITPIEPVTPQHVSKPILIAATPTTAYIYSYRGKINPDSSIGGGHNVIYDVSQVNHNFSVGQVLYFNESDQKYELATANTQATAEAIGLVAAVASPSSFSLLTAGYIDTLSGLTLGTLFLSDQTPGLLTAVEPTAVGSITKPLFIATSPTSGFFVNWRGSIIPEPSSNTSNPNPTAATTNVTATPNSTIRTYSSQTSPLQINLPSDFQVDDALRVIDANGYGWAIIQSAGQQIFAAGDPNPQATTLGTQGSVTSNNSKYAFVELTCIAAGTTFVMTGVVGNIGFS